MKLSWKTMSLKDKIMAGIACAICLVIVAFIIYSAVGVGLAFAPTNNSAPEDNTVYDFIFDGNITLNNETYDVRLKAKDGKFKVDAGKLNEVTKGTYTATQGQGWTFQFDDNNSTAVRSQYDKDSKTHSFIYTIDIGVRGSGNIKLEYKDDAFVAAEQPWGDIPSFGGSGSIYNMTIPLVLGCDADGGFRLWCTDGIFAVPETIGTYKYENGVYTFTCEDNTVYTTEIDSSTGLHTFTVNFIIGALGVPSTAVMTQIVLSVN